MGWNSATSKLPPISPPSSSAFLYDCLHLGGGGGGARAEAGMIVGCVCVVQSLTSFQLDGRLDSLCLTSKWAARILPSFSAWPAAAPAAAEEGLWCLAM